MESNENDLIRTEIKLTNENQQNLQSKFDENSVKVVLNNQKYDLLILNNEEKGGNNNRYYQKDIIKGNKAKTIQYSKKQIYKKVRSDSYKHPFKKEKAQISNYIYKPISTNFLTNDYTRYNSNSKYSIKNPIKEKSKNKLKKNNSQYQNIIYKNKNNKNIRLINSIINNTDINEDGNNNCIYNDNNEEEKKIVSNTNYNIRQMNDFNLNINNTEFSESAYQMDTNTNKNKGGNIDLNPIKKHYISFNENINSKKYHKSPRDERISYIYDYSQENNKDSYCIESPNSIRHLSIFPLKSRLKRIDRANYITFDNKSSKRYHDKLKKEIEKSRLKFEKIREIEKKIKKYFNINGLNIENRELYDQSATMIQSAFRAYFSRMKLYKELNLFVNVGAIYETLKKIIIPRKMDYWQDFLKGILNFLSFLNNMNFNNNVQENNSYKESKNISNSYRKKKSNKLLIPQLCVSFGLMKSKIYVNKDNINIDKDNEKKYLEEKLNKIMLENEELKKINENMKIQYENINKENNNINNMNCIIKNTQESVELNLNDEINLPLIDNNKENKKLFSKETKLKYIIKNKISKEKNILYKYFLKFHYNSIILKNSIIYSKTKIKNSISSNNSNSEYSFREKKNDNFKIKKLKNIFKILDLKIKSDFHNKFIIFYFKGLLNQIKNDNNKQERNIKNEDNNIKNKNNDKNELMSNENKKDN